MMCDPGSFGQPFCVHHMQRAAEKSIPPRKGKRSQRKLGWALGKGAKRGFGDCDTQMYETTRYVAVEQRPVKESLS